MLASATFAASAYSASVFGTGLWSMLFIGLSLVLVASLALPVLNTFSRAVGKFTGVAALLGFALLMLASTVGGASSTSESNEIIAVALVIIGVLGCGFFLFRDKPAVA